MKIAVQKLTEAEITEQNQIIEKYTRLLNKEIKFGDLMDVAKVADYTATIKGAHKLINEGMIFDNPWMVNQLEGHPNVTISEI